MLTKIEPENIEQITFGTQPERSFYSNSLGVISGSINVLSFGSERQKKIIAFNSTSINSDSDPKFILKLAKNNFSNGNINSEINQYFGLIHDLPKDERLDKQIKIERFEPGVELNQNFMVKSLIKNCLFKNYRLERPTYNFSFTNYNSLNFYSASVSSSVFLYPQSVTTLDNSAISASYLPTGSFTFDFWIKPTFKSVEYKQISFSIVGGTIGVIVASLIMLYLEYTFYRALFGVLIICAVIISLMGYSVKITSASSLITGSISGFIGTLTSAGGAPMGLLYQNSTQEGIKANLNVFFVYINVLAIITLSIAGLVEVNDFYIFFKCVPAILIGWSIAVWLAVMPTAAN